MTLRDQICPKKFREEVLKKKKNQNLITIYTTVPNSNQFGDEQILVPNLAKTNEWKHF